MNIEAMKKTKKHQNKKIKVNNQIPIFNHHYYICN